MMRTPTKANPAEKRKRSMDKNMEIESEENMSSDSEAEDTPAPKKVAKSDQSVSEFQLLTNMLMKMQASMDKKMNEIGGKIEKDMEEIKASHSNMQKSLDGVVNRLTTIETDIGGIKQQQIEQRADINKIQEEQSVQAQKMNDIQENNKKSLERMENIVKNLEGRCDAVEEKNDRLWRGTNIILHGVPETDNAINIAKEVLEVIMPGKDLTRKISRFGKEGIQNRVRPFRIRLSSTDEVMSALERSKKLREMEKFKFLYITKDETKAQQEQTKKRRQEYQLNKKKEEEEQSRLSATQATSSTVQVDNGNVATNQSTKDQE